MNRLGILSVYDQQGVIDDYVCFFIKSLMDVLKDLIIVVNGNVNSDGIDKFQQITDKIIIRDNLGYDAGGYKEAMLTYGKEFILNYDEVVICNDTCFGPFIPFKKIFAKMDKINEDFWGFQYTDNDYLSILGTFFVVYKNNIISDVYDFYTKLDAEHMSRDEIVRYAELGIFNYLLEKNYTYTYFSACNNYDMYKSPNYYIKECGIPLMKKRCFDPIKYHKDNCIDALKTINRLYDYNISMILDVIYRKYDIRYDLEFEFNRKLNIEHIKFPPVKNTISDILDFVQDTPEIYIYGSGFYGQLILPKLSKYKKIMGFVVSDDKYEEEYVLGLKVYKASDVNLENDMIIVAVKYADELKEKYGNRENVFFLF